MDKKGQDQLGDRRNPRGGRTHGEVSLAECDVEAGRHDTISGGRSRAEPGSAGCVEPRFSRWADEAGGSREAWQATGK